MVKDNSRAAARLRPVTVPAKRRHQFLPVGRVSALVEGDGGLLEVLPNNMIRAGHAWGSGHAEVDHTRVIRIGQPMPGTDHARQARDALRVGAADVEEFHRLSGPQIRPRHRVVDIESVPAFVQHGTTHKVMRRHPGKQPCLKLVQGIGQDRRCHGGAGLTEAQHKRIIGELGRHEITADPVEPSRIPGQNAWRHGTGLPGRVHCRSHVTAEGGLADFDYADMHLEITWRLSRTRPPPRGGVPPRSLRSPRQQTVQARSPGRPGDAGPARDPESNGRAGFQLAPAN